MAITIRLDEQQEILLGSFMENSGHATKSKSVLWLIENAERLIAADEKLNAITVAYERQQAESDLIAKLLTR